MRLFLVFLVLLSLLLFRSYYLPSPDGYDTDFGLAPAEGWWQRFHSAPDDTLGDVQVKEDGGDVQVEKVSGNVQVEEDVGDVQIEDVGGDVQALDDGGEGTDLTSEITDFEDSFLPASSASPSPSPPSEVKYKPPPISSAKSETKSKSSSPVPDFDPSIPACRQLPGADKVVVIVKTGATEVFARVPGQLITLAECVPNLMIFSDLEQDLGHFHIYDALDEIGKEYKENHEDFEFYNNLHRAHAMHGDVSVLGSEKGWNLDKWKNIPMLHKAYTKHPDADWYLTIDADTYLGWNNLLLLLDSMDPDEPLYAGAVYWHGPTSFAQGGTGYLLSRNAVERFEGIRNAEKIADWEKETSTICCGDVMMGVAMGHANVGVSGAWPMFQVDPPCFLSWTSAYWCIPAITWHHVHSYDIVGLWEFEKEWINKTWDAEDPGAVPYLYSDAFEHFVQPNIADVKEDWNNYSGDKIFTKPKEDHVKEEHDWDGRNDDEKKELWASLSKLQKRSVKSIELCRAACEDDEKCVQFSWHPGTCKLNHTIRLGHNTDPKDEYTSGWMLDRVDAFIEEMGECAEPDYHIDH